MAQETIFTSKNLVIILVLIGNSNSLNEHMGITKVHMKYTREPLKYRKRRTKLQELREIRNRQSNKRYYPCTKGLNSQIQAEKWIEYMIMYLPCVSSKHRSYFQLLLPSIPKKLATNLLHMPAVKEISF
jgi:hypothetical protein